MQSADIAVLAIYGAEELAEKGQQSNSIDCGKQFLVYDRATEMRSLHIWNPSWVRV